MPNGFEKPITPSATKKGSQAYRKFLKEAAEKIAQKGEAPAEAPLAIDWERAEVTRREAPAEVERLAGPEREAAAETALEEGEAIGEVSREDLLASLKSRLGEETGQEVFDKFLMRLGEEFEGKISGDMITANEDVMSLLRTVEEEILGGARRP